MEIIYIITHLVMAICMITILYLSFEPDRTIGEGPGNSDGHMDVLFKIASKKHSNINKYIMKNSIKISVTTLALLSFLSLHSNAQTTTTTENYGSGIRLSIGVDGGLPLGSLKDAYDWSLGGSVQADFPIVKDQLYATLNGGYNNFFAKNSNNSNDLNLIPVKAGLKYFPVKCFYIQGEAGATFLANRNTVGANKSTAFVYAPQVGVLLNTGGKNYFDAGFRFEGNTKFYDGGKSNNFLALRLAYSFDL